MCDQDVCMRDLRRMQMAHGPPLLNMPARIALALG